MKASSKLVLTIALIEAIKPHAQTIVDGSGKLWNAARDAYNIALVDFPEATDAAKAVKQVIVNELKANDGSCRAYFSTLVWLTTNGHDSATMSMADATELRYPKQEPIAADDFEGQLKRETERSQKRQAKIQKAAEDYQATQSPRGLLLQQVASLLADCDDAELALIAAELISIKATLRADEATFEQDVEQAVAVAA